MILKEKIMEVLDSVKDPEIPVVSVVDLGMIHKVHFQGDQATIEVMPTFSGCPALEIIKRNIEQAVESIPEVKSLAVTFIRHPIWTTDLISENAKQELKKFGIAPPEDQVNGEWHVPCPYCGSVYTTMDNIFGPAACRSILYCKTCKNPFEAMKPVSI
ncbi:1,2-phenylacetyl-CoA epoxidase subunit PaaD [Guptibacillus spartinae]|uniref:1,2-phenylacetyl-CoA epoxidase subunit PaaD n=1 Tax=Guptibacillus spartinae TaxID=3025679 RepID=UPI002361E5F3|nr:1,2-phenylacetyl-CoA epoxidase subunit PaaD [Pseudalkalibacillus spartinae]